MTSPAFQVFSDAFGNLYVQDGMVAQLKTGVRIPVGAGGNFVPPALWENGPYLPASQALGATFVGGSGRNLALTGLPVPLSGVMPPVGLFSPTRPDTFVRGIFTLAVTGASAATIHDGTDVVAELTTGGTAPIGDYVATTYGRATYNATTAFTIAAALEIAGGGAIPDAGVLVSAGTAQGGTYTATNSALYVSATDSAWTIATATDGSAELRIDSTAIATRAAGACAWLPDGFYQATAAGMAAYNLTDAEPVNGEAFNVFVSSAARMPRAGFVYLEITESASVLTAVAGPYFATSLPADSATVFHVPLAQCDGSAIEQFHTGLLVWPEAAGAHAATHASGGADPISPASIGALAASAASAFGLSLLDDATADDALNTLGAGATGSAVFQAATAAAAKDLVDVGRTRMAGFEQDFLAMSGNVPPFSFSFTSGGTITMVAGADANHPGVLAFGDSTTANGGSRLASDWTAINLCGGEKLTSVFRIVSNRTTQVVVMGLTNCQSATSRETNGVWLEFIGNGSTGAVATGKCKKASGGTTSTGTTFPCLSNTWYTSVISLNSDATVATFEIFNEAGVSQWSSTVNANIPNAAGQVVGVIYVAWQTTTDAATTMFQLDYSRYECSRALTR